MLLVRFAIGDVVDQVGGRRQAAEDGERGNGARHRVAVEEAAAEEEPGEDHQVLRPLLRADRR